MEILIAYSTSAATADCFRKSQMVQKVYPLAANIRQIAFSDAPIQDIGMEVVVDPFLSGPGGYWHSRFRNLTFRAATKSKADYLIVLDSDAVFLGFNGADPKSDFEVIPIFFQRQDEEITGELLADKARWQEASWWVYGRALFTQPWCRSHEGFIGYGFEDYDFIFNVMKPHGVEMTPSAASAIHLWHPPRRDTLDAVDSEAARNKRLFEGRTSMTLA